MFRFLVILFVIISCAGCERDKQLWQKAANGVVITENPYHWYIESFKHTYSGAILPIYYIGERVDNLYINDFPIPARQYFSLDTPYTGAYCISDTARIKLFVDTSIVTYYSHSEVRETISGESILDAKKQIQQYVVISHAAHPVFLYNNSDSIFFAGDGNVLGATTIEAIDSNGNWQRVVNRHEYQCGTGLRELILKPNDMLLAKYPIRTGSTYTRLRLKVQRWKSLLPVYSNEFWGYITFPPPAEL